VPMSIQEPLKPKLTRSQSAIKAFLDSAPTSELQNDGSQPEACPSAYFCPDPLVTSYDPLKNKSFWAR
jgi:hypothetical protein